MENSAVRAATTSPKIKGAARKCIPAPMTMSGRAMKMSSINAGAERVQGVREGKGLNSIHAFWHSPAFHDIRLRSRTKSRHWRLQFSSGLRCGRADKHSHVEMREILKCKARTATCQIQNVFVVNSNSQGPETPCRS
jgi:hypothetical protein